MEPQKINCYECLKQFEITIINDGFGLDEIVNGVKEFECPYCGNICSRQVKDGIIDNTDPRPKAKAKDDWIHFTNWCTTDWGATTATAYVPNRAHYTTTTTFV